MKEIEILDKGNTQFKLTVTPTRVTIKLKKDTTEEFKTIAINFLTEVSNAPEMLYTDCSMRGKLDKQIESDKLSITMYSDNKKLFYTYGEKLS